MGGLTFDKLLLVGVVAVFLLGPERLPHYASQLARLVRSVRDMANGAKERMREEMGPDFDDVDWKKLDPRQYDPRRIIREALLDDEDDSVAGPPLPAVRAPRTRNRSAGGAVAAGAASAAAAGVDTGAGATGTDANDTGAPGTTGDPETPDIHPVDADEGQKARILFDTEAT